MKKHLVLIFLFFIAGLSALADTTVKATDPAINITGRVQRLDDGSVRYDWVGTYLRTSFTGSAVSIRVAEEGESWHNVFIDGKFRQKIHITGKESHDVVLADGLGKGTHRLELQKCTEGEFGLVRLYSLTATGKGSFKAVAPRQRLIEILGDSNTCGYGVEAESRKERFKLSTENCDLAYGCLIARYFDADYSIVAHSGMGVTRNYAGKPLRTMSERYLMLFDDHDSVAYDFKAYTPDLVIINLGPNDFSTQAAPAGFIEKYIELINTVRSHYGDVPILCVVSHSANMFLQAALQEVKARIADMEGVRVAQPMPGILVDDTDRGADYHANWRGQRKIAMTLIPQVAAMTGWELRGL